MRRHCGTCRDSINGMPNKCNSRKCLSTNMGLWREPLEPKPAPATDPICDGCNDGPKVECKRKCSDYSMFLSKTSPFAGKAKEEKKTYDSPLPIPGEPPEEDLAEVPTVKKEIGDPELKPIVPGELHPEAIPETSEKGSEYVKKADFGKTDMTLLRYFKNALVEVCKQSEFGCLKYERGSFKDVPNARRRYDAALMRHWLEEGDDDDIVIDPETDLEHDVATAWNALCKLELRLRGYVSGSDTNQ